MGKYELWRTKFKQDHDNIASSTQRANQKLELVRGKQLDLWKTLEQEAKDAVAEVNGGMSILVFAGHDYGDLPGFDIAFNRDGENRRATVDFREDAHTVDVSIAIPQKQITKRTYEITANNQNEVVFDKADDAESVVKNTLAALLAGFKD